MGKEKAEQKPPIYKNYYFWSAIVVIATIITIAAIASANRLPTVSEAYSGYSSPDTSGGTYKVQNTYKSTEPNSTASTKDSSTASPSPNASTSSTSSSTSSSSSSSNYSYFTQSEMEKYCQEGFTTDILGYFSGQKISVIDLWEYNVYFDESFGKKDGAPYALLTWNGKNNTTNKLISFQCYAQIIGGEKKLLYLGIDGYTVRGTMPW